MKKINVFQGLRFEFPSHINEFLIQREDSENSEAFLVIVPCGGVVPWHAHDDMEQTFFIVEGRGTISTRKFDSDSPVETKVERYDLIHISRTELHSASADGPDPLRYLCINSFSGAKAVGHQSSLEHALGAAGNFEQTSKVRTNFNENAVIVTGASGFLGSAIVSHLLSRGDSVIGIDTGFARSKLGDVSSKRYRFIAADVTSEFEVQRAFNEIKNEFGGFHSLILCHGDSGNKVDTLKISPDAFQQELNSIVVSNFMLAQQFSLLPRKNGSHSSVLFIGSVGGLRAHREQVAYDTAKGALVSMTRALALDLAPLGISVNTLAIGPLEDSKTSKEDTGENASRLKELVPLQRYATRSEVTKMVANLIDRETQFFTGQTVYLDGGLSIQLRPVSVERLNNPEHYLRSPCEKSLKGE